MRVVPTHLLLSFLKENLLHAIGHLHIWPSRFDFFSNLGHFNVTLLAKFKCERKNEMNSGVSSKKTSSHKWPISK